MTETEPARVGKMNLWVTRSGSDQDVIPTVLTAVAPLEDLNGSPNVMQKPGSH